VGTESRKVGASVRGIILGCPFILRPFVADEGDMATSSRSAFHVLLIEDERPLRQAIYLALRSKGFRVTCASSAENALSWLSDHQPDLIITDLALPEMSGFDLIAAVETLVANPPPIIVLTAVRDAFTAARLYRDGVREVLTKSQFPIRDLIHTVQLYTAIEHREQIAAA